MLCSEKVACDSIEIAYAARRLDWGIKVWRGTKADLENGRQAFYTILKSSGLS